MSFEWAIRSAAFMRRAFPRAVLVAGGELATLRRHDLISRGAFDAIVAEEGEVSFMDLCLCVLAGDRQPRLAGVHLADGSDKASGRELMRDLDSLPLPAVNAFRWREYGQWSLFSSRGCPYRCVYCSSAAYWRHTIRYHGAPRVVEELRRLKKDFGAESVYIADDTFTMVPQRVYEIARGIRRERLGLTWSCLTRVDRVDRSLLEEMRRGGCVMISFGLETASDTALATVEKRATAERARQTIRLCREFGIRTRVSVIIGLPGDNKHGLRQTLEFLHDERPNEIQIYGLTPHDGTALYDDLDRFGVTILEPEPMLWSRNVFAPVCETVELQRDEIARIGRDWIGSLVEQGYVFLDEAMPSRKIGAEFTVATAFAPVQAIGSPVGASV
jgi:radical SAM superfamily enzyme YgiQ (UPF0313 family)